MSVITGGGAYLLNTDMNRSNDQKYGGRGRGGA